MKQKLLAVMIQSILLSGLFLSSNYSMAEQQETTELDSIVVTGVKKLKKTYGEIYRKPMSIDYIGRKEIERIKISNPADLITRIAGVQSGDARNSGAIDPNIRGIQGQGRVPLTVDGTEQAITVYRGSTGGVSNRNYLDPNFISDILVEKGPAISRDTKSSVGGAIAMKTISANDIVPDDQNFGFQFKVETADNTTKERYPNYYFGKYIGDYPSSKPNQTDTDKYKEFNPEQDTTSRLTVKQRGNSPSNFFKDNNVFAAAAYRNDMFEALAAYSYRQKGNYFTGKNGARYYTNIRGSSIKHNQENQGEQPLYDVTKIYPTQSEVANTFYNSKSLLLKGALNLPHNQRIETGLRHSDINYGEIMPYRLLPVAKADDGLHIVKPPVGEQDFWPESNIKLDTYNLQYTARPENNKWIDFSANIWMTKSKTNMNNDAEALLGLNKGERNPLTGEMVGCTEETLSRDNPNCYFYNLAKTKFHNDRKGITLSNNFKILPSLNLTLLGSYQTEKRLKDSNVGNDQNLMTHQLLYRNVARKEYQLGFNFEWTPIHWLTISAGAQKNNASAQDHDRGLFQPTGKLSAIEYSLPRYATYDEVPNSIRANLAAAGKSEQEIQARINSFHAEVSRVDYQKEPSDYITHYGASHPFRESVYWYPNQKGDFDIKDNPINNGTATELFLKNQYQAHVRDPHTDRDKEGKTAEGTGVIVQNHYGKQSTPINEFRFKTPWTPMGSVQIKLSDTDTIYARYAETWRNPSIYEIFPIFATSSPNLLNYHRYLRPEKGRNIELGWSKDLSEYFDDNIANLKLTYYQNTIKDVIDRTDNEVVNAGTIKTRGFEIQGRFDDGKTFATLGFNVSMKNQFCSNSNITTLDMTNQSIQGNEWLHDPKLKDRYAIVYPKGHPKYQEVNEFNYKITDNKDSGQVTDISYSNERLNYIKERPRCYEGGKPGGFLANMIQPKFSANLNIGRRFFDDKLVLAANVRWFSKYSNNFENNRNQVKKDKNNKSASPTLNVPVGWDDNVIVDINAQYNITKNIGVNLIISNLTNRYYIDPLSRSNMPAPGRAITLGISGKF